jgi:beta-lactamase class A
MIRSVMMYSDNTSSDRLMRLVGGVEGVTAHVRSRGIPDCPTGRTWRWRCW